MPTPSLFESCQLAKRKHLPFSLNEKRDSHILDLIHCDIWGPAPVYSSNKFCYHVVFIDDSTRFTQFYSLALKSDLYATLRSFTALVENQFNFTIKKFPSDGGTDFTNKNVKDFFCTKGIQNLFSWCYTRGQNGRASSHH